MTLRKCDPMVSDLSPATFPRRTSLLQRSLGPLALRMVGGEYDQRTIQLTSPKVAIGSGAACTLRLVGCGLRPVELFVLRGPGGLVAQNHSPGNLLNGRAFTEARLSGGDHLTIGTLELEIVSPGVASSEGSEAVDSTSSGEAQSSAAQALETLQQRVAELEQEQHGDYARWHAEQEQWIEELTHARRQAIELQAEVQQLTAEQDDARTEAVQELTFERDQLRTESESLRGRLAELPAWIERAERSEVALAELSQTQQQAEQAFKAQQHALTLDLDTSHQKLAELQSSQQQCEQLQQQVAELTGRLEQADANVRLLQQAADEQQQEMARERTSPAKLEEWAEQCQDLRNQVQAGQSSLAEAHQRIAELEAEAGDIRAQAAAEVAQAELATEQLLGWEQRSAELESREQQLQHREQQCEQAAAVLEQREQALLAKQAEPAQAGADAAASSPQAGATSGDNEQALAELLRLREQLDQRETELKHLESHLTQREAAIHTLEASASQQHDDADLSQHTVVLTGQDSFAQATAQRILGEPDDENIPDESSDGSSGHYNDDDTEQEQEDLILHATVDYSPADEELAERPVAATEIFQAPTQGAPVSAAEVLAKYTGRAMVLDDEEPANAASAPTHTEEETTVEDDDSIQQYMDQLMRRVRGEPSDSPAPSREVEPRRETKVEPEATPAPSPASEASFASGGSVISSEQYMPRSSAPEKSEKLAKMRELANSSARTAIDTASRTQRTKTAAIHAGMATAAAIAGTTLIGYAASDGSLVRIGTAVMSLGAAAWWAYRAVTYALGMKTLPTRSWWSYFKRSGTRRQEPASVPGANVKPADPTNESA
jgi:hypothetical protein